ncbi:MAG: hypothetical protein ACREL5_00270 [Gemmatimonadales bacterium]
MLITENSLDQWVRGHAETAQAAIVDLVADLVAVSAPRPNDRRFPRGDSIGQHGSDGFLDSLTAYPPYVPAGKSFWEIGTDLGARRKATNDYTQRTKETPTDERQESSFVFVTPLSGRRGWKGTWKPDGQRAWIRQREAEKKWKYVRVIDGTKLVAWIRQWPAIELSLAGLVLNASPNDLEAAGECWKWLSEVGSPHCLVPALFLRGREEATSKLMVVLRGEQTMLKLITKYPADVVPFVVAAIASLDDPIRSEIVNRTLVVSSHEAWAAVSALDDPHVLIAKSKVDLDGDEGLRLVQLARNKGHAIVWGGPGAGRPEPSSVRLAAPNVQDVRQALEEASFPRERARSLAQHSGGDLSSLLRLIQGLAAAPEWVRTDAAAELAIAMLLGSWEDASAADRTVVEELSGKGYGEWIETIREAADRPGTPLVHNNGSWRFVSRYEAWFGLGGRIFDQHLDRFLTVTKRVFAEEDPALALPKDERWLASVKGRKGLYSRLLRHGLADGLALMGSHSSALSSCSLGKSELTAALAVRTILGTPNWERWATLDRLLPLFAEAAPDEFLQAVEHAATSEDAPFERLYDQEGDALTGGNYVSGTLWALETLAWSPQFLSRVTLCLGELASRDPGGKWSNRPANSLRAIFLPWFPQTTASLDQQRGALKALSQEYPQVAWKLLLALLPEVSGFSAGSAKPSWRDFIPEDWKEETFRQQRRSQEEYFTTAAIALAGNDTGKLAELVDHLGQLPELAMTALLEKLKSPGVVELPESERKAVWEKLTRLVATHTKFSDADWALGSVHLAGISAVADRLAPKAPMLLYQRLFSERSFELFETKGDYDEQGRLLERRRDEAVAEIAEAGGANAVVDLATSAESPWLVGISYGRVGNGESDAHLLPDLVTAEDRAVFQFVAGYVGSRFHTDGPLWPDTLALQDWFVEQKAAFLCFLPFDEATWARVAAALGTDQSLYWLNTDASPYRVSGDLRIGVDGLLEYHRPRAALRCLNWMLHRTKTVDVSRTVRALIGATRSTDKGRADNHEVVDLIKALQDDPATKIEDLFRIEWAYLQLLDRYHGAKPRTLENRLAVDPAFFGEAVRVTFRSTKAAPDSDTPDKATQDMAGNAYRLLTNWSVPPGLRTDGTMAENELESWLAAVKRECTDSGHVEIAMEMVGHVLTHTPVDPDGLWIHRAAAEVLNARDGENLRTGFSSELYNRRGAHWVDPTGDAERGLAAAFRGKADAVDGAGYSRLADSLRQLARSYDHEAEIVASSARFDG